MRVTDEMVRSVLTWARNYGEITQFQMLTTRGRKWEITLPEPRIVGIPPGPMMAILGVRPQDAVPPVITLTSREAMAFGYGCAVGGIHDRKEFARAEWGWDDA